MYNFKSDPRFKDIRPLATKISLASPTMHGEELDYIKEAINSGWVTTVGENIDQLEKQAANIVGVPYAVGLSCGTAALHLAVKLAAERLYGSSSGISTPFGLGRGGCLYGKRVFCSDMTFAATVNPIVYEGGEPVFIDTEYDTWNMSPEALEQAFKIYPDVKLVVLVHLYGTPGKIDEIKGICQKYGALLIEDAAESFGASYKNQQTGVFGDYAVLSFNGNKIITGSSGGMLLVNDEYSANKARKWSTQSREAAPWYQHEELGYNYRMSNIIAGIVRGQLGHLSEHIESKKRIYEKYKSELADLPVAMNPMDLSKSEPNYWLSCMVIDSDAMCETQRSDRQVIWNTEKNKSCPSEILGILDHINMEGRPIWKPMHMQNIYKNCSFVGDSGFMRGKTNAYISSKNNIAVGEDIFDRGLCLPSDNKMTMEQQDRVIDIIHRCFWKRY
jgi:dTDP-4-amino-4,6-dideoxygalactose transaminase